MTVVGWEGLEAVGEVRFVRGWLTVSWSCFLRSSMLVLVGVVVSDIPMVWFSLLPSSCERGKVQQSPPAEEGPGPF